MSDTPIAPTEAPNTVPPGEPKTAAQDNAGDTKPLTEAQKQK